jgi:type II secretory pathway pseudopilin PulG
VGYVRWASARRALPGVPEHDDQGLTLIELLVTFILIGTSITALFAAWQGNIKSADRHRSQTQVQTVLITSAEWITSRDLPLISCGSPALDAAYLSYADNGLPGSWPSSLLTLESVQYWDGDRQIYVSAEVPADCPRDLRAPQLVTLRLQHPDNNVQRTLTVMKADV